MEEFIKLLHEAETIEQDGHRYYIDSMEKTKNGFAKELFKSLAGEEMVHYNRIRQIAEMLTEGKKISEDDIRLSGKGGQVFDSLISDFKSDQPAGSEIEALAFAKKLEQKSIAHYKNAMKSATDATVRKFLSQLVIEEEGHFRSISESIEYIEDPQAWFSRQERSHFDGA
jgi:rubrerythrin